MPSQSMWVLLLYGLAGPPTPHVALCEIACPLICWLRPTTQTAPLDLHALLLPSDFCDHLVLSSAGLKYNLDPNPVHIDAHLERTLTTLRESATNTDAPPPYLINVGGGQSPQQLLLALSTRFQRARIIRHLKNILDKYKISGVAVVLPHKTVTQVQTFLTELRRNLLPSQKIVVAIHGTPVAANEYNISEIEAAADFITILDVTEILEKALNVSDLLFAPGCSRNLK